jgi:hypothetical protein
MNRGDIDMTQKEREHQNCSVLFEEIKERLLQLRNSGISVSEIASLFIVEMPLKKLIVSRNFRIFLGDERVEVHMEPLVKSVYLLFLKHPEGINFKDMPDYREELARIYDRVRPWGLTDRAMQSIEDVTNPLLNSINEKCARIRKVFASMLDRSIAEEYYIKGKRGRVKKISLPRELVVWE